MSGTWCFLCRAPFEHCLCGADPVEVRRALAAIARVHVRSPHGLCSGCRGAAEHCVCLRALEELR